MDTHPTVRSFVVRYVVFVPPLFVLFSARGAYHISYSDLSQLGGAVAFTSGTQHVGVAYAYVTNYSVFAAIWSGASNVVNLSPTGALGSYANGGSVTQQVGTVWFDEYLDHPVFAALWNGSAESFRNLAPPDALYSQAYGTSGTQQVGEADFGPPSWHVAAALWSGTAESFVDLAPPGTNAIAFAVAAGQQAGAVYFWGNPPHAAIWSGTAASFKDLNPSGSPGSVIYATTGSQQVGGDHLGAGLWSGTPESFVSLAPPGGHYYSVALATIGTAQAGYIQSTNYGSEGHAVIWFSSATRFIDLHPSLPAEIYRDSQAQSLWSDGTNIIVAGLADVWRGFVHPIVWTLTPEACPLTCPTNISRCNDPGQCGALVEYTPPVSSGCTGVVVTCVPPSGAFFPVGTNAVVCTAVDPGPGEMTNTCAFLVVVHDCESPSIESLTATPAVLWPPDHKMQPVTLLVSATDNCHVASTRIVQVTSNEPGSSPDWEITGDLTLNLRAERSRFGSGRIYSISVECADDSGNTSTAVINVTVPHSRTNFPQGESEPPG